MKNRITVAIADDHPVLLAGMTSLFSLSDRHVVVGEAACADTSMELVREVLARTE